MTVASFVVAQRTDHGVPHAISCRALGVSECWFYKWRDRPPSPRQARRADLDAKVKAAFDASGGAYGSPRILDELRDAGEGVSKKTVEASMAGQGLVARPGPRRRHWLTRQAKGAERFPDLIGRDFHAAGINLKWSGDLTEIPTDDAPPGAPTGPPPGPRHGQMSGHGVATTSTATARPDPPAAQATPAVAMVRPTNHGALR